MRALLVAVLISGAGPVAFAGSAAGQHAATVVDARRGAAGIESSAGLAAPPRVRHPFGTETVLVSQSSTGERAPRGGGSAAADISGDGRFVVFESSASNLVPGDTNGRVDLFLRDLVTGTTTLIAPTASEEHTSISADGRYVAFLDGNNLDPADTNNLPDVFLYDRVLDTTRVLTVDPATGKAFGGQRPRLSPDGDHLVFLTKKRLDSNDIDGIGPDADFYLLTISTGQFTWVSVGLRSGAVSRFLPGPYEASVDAHGDRVMFVTRSSEFAARDTNGVADLFVRDLRAGTTTRVSLSSAGKQLQAPSESGQISGNGQVVTFTTGGRVVPGDHNHHVDVFARNLATGRTRIVSVGPNEQPGDGDSFSDGISRDGHLIAFDSQSTSFLPGKPQPLSSVMFVRDMRAGTTRTCLVRADGQVSGEGTVTAVPGALSADGQHCVFTTRAGSLVRPPDVNNDIDVYVRR